MSNSPSTIIECYHCSEKFSSSPGAQKHQAKVDEEIRFFCCPACQAVAEAIQNEGFSQFYKYRDSKNPKPELNTNTYQAYDIKEVQQDFVTPFDNTGTLLNAQLLIPNIACAACAWLIENYLKQTEEIKKVNVNVVNQQCRITWNASQLKLSEIFVMLASIGYTAVPATPNLLAVSRKKHTRSLLIRLGLAGMGMMQVGMVAIALHAGDIQGIDTHWRGYLRWVSLLFALPVMLYSAQPFYASAFRALRLKSLNMDVSVSAALILAFVASVWATIFNTGQVYFDSLSMLVFFLLLGRFLEMRARHSQQNHLEDLTSLLPLTVNKVTGHLTETVPIKSIQKGDRIEVDSGSVFPCDGEIIDGHSHVDESILTGESSPILKTPGDFVFSGTCNGSSSLTIQVSLIGEQSKLHTINKMRSQAAEEKPKYQTLANKLSAWFVFLVLLISTCNYIIWTLISPDQAFWITLSVLVVTCPCALSLATPAALTAGVLRMQSLGLLITSHQFLERLQSVTHVVFDKTGTLTTGKLKIARVQMLTQHTTGTLPRLEPSNEKEVLKIIAALEAKSTHPIASAFKHIAYSNAATNVSSQDAQGIQGDICNTNYRFGKSQFSKQNENLAYPGSGAWQLLATTNRAIAWILLEDQIKPGVKGLLQSLLQSGKKVSILSGDRKVNVASLADSIGISDYTAEASPSDKLEYIQNLQNKGASVLMVGDGINDIPTLSAADASIAMGSATQLAQTSADSILLSNDPSAVLQTLNLSNAVNNKIKQNFGWAIFYNAIALPLAVLGYIPPYVAAVGMSLSSLIVVLNSTSLRRVKLSFD